MLLIRLEGGLVSGVYSDDHHDIGKPVFVADYDTDNLDADEEAFLTDICGDGKHAHLHVEDMQYLSQAEVDKLTAWRDSV